MTTSAIPPHVPRIVHYALLAAAGYAQIRPDGYEEPSVVTLGEDLSAVKELLRGLSAGQESFTIGKALQYIKRGLAPMHG